MQLAQELLALHGQYGNTFNYINIATCWSRLGQVKSPEEIGCLRSNDGKPLTALREQTRLQVWSLKG